jgi:hypothetical protein
MMPSEPFSPRSRNLSYAWAEIFLKLMSRGVQHLPFVITNITDFEEEEPVEDPALRERLDLELETHGEQSCHTVANTIFPQKLWRPNAGDTPQAVYERYSRIWPYIKRHPANRRGVYFRRLTSYSPKVDGQDTLPINQLQHIIDTYNSGNHRRSALQAPIFDPTRDHTDNRQGGFPCLQQVIFTPDDQGGLTLTGLYVTQYFFEKAYGNYLGLCHLGRFMAANMGLSLVQVICIASIAKLGNSSKNGLQTLADDVAAILRAQEGTRS